MTDPDRLQQIYRQFADVECRGYSEHYFTLAHAVADCEELLAFLAPLPVVQPNLFLAAIHFLAGSEAMPQSGTELRAYVHANRGEVESLMRARRTQTNEVGRCAVLLPALPAGPLAMVEVGASAGLCLLMDEYHYNYGDRQLGDSMSIVRLRCELSGSPPIPAAMPRIEWWAGLDLQPVDLRSEEDVRWLEACVFADHEERRQRLRSAIYLARSRWIQVRRGNLLTDLPQLVAEIPAPLKVVIFHSAVLSYVTPEERVTFAESLASIAKARDIVWISNEAQTVVPEITSLAPPLPARSFLLGRTTFSGGKRHDELLAAAHPHGAELHWMTK